MGSLLKVRTWPEWDPLGGLATQDISDSAVATVLAFLGLFLYGGKRFSRKMQLFFAVMLWVGSWLSGFFIITAHAWMQHPVGYEIAADGTCHLTSFWALLFNRWALWEYPHVMGGAVVTGGFVVAAVGAFHLLSKRHEEQGRLFVATGVIAAGIAAFLQLWPTGDAQGQLVTEHQPITLAAMEGLFHTEKGASMVLIGQPNMETQAIDNPISIPKALSFLTHRRWEATVPGLDSFPRDQWPDNIPLLYYCYHIMVGLGTIFLGITGLSLLLLWRKKLFTTRGMLWILMLSFPFPFIANTAGWITAELGRQPWIVHGLMRTADGHSLTVSAGNALFTLLGWMGLYALLSIIYTFLFWHEVRHGLDRKEANEMQNAK